MKIGGAETDWGLGVAFLLVVVVVFAIAYAAGAPGWAAFLGSQVVGFLWLISARIAP
jgi:hypothetical protein